jgi:hypothetical protein
VFCSLYAIKKAGILKNIDGKLVGLIVLCVAPILFFAVYVANTFLPGSISSAPHGQPEEIEKYIHYLDSLLTSVDQLVSMLVTIQLSLFIIAGFALNSEVRGVKRPSIFIIVVGGIFVITALMSLTLGYTARIQAATLVQWGKTDFQSVRETAVNESKCVVTSAVAAVCMMVATLLRNGAGERLQGQAAHRTLGDDPQHSETSQTASLEGQGTLEGKGNEAAASQVRVDTVLQGSLKPEEERKQ